MIESKYEKHFNYIMNQRERLCELEKEVDKIKNDKRWKAAMNYFKQRKYQGEMLEAPSKKNGYKIVEF